MRLSRRHVAGRLWFMTFLLWACGAGANMQPDGAPDVDESPAVLIDDIQFVNRVYFKKTTIQKFIQSRIGAFYDAQQAEEDARRLKDAYISRGFFKAKVAVDFMSSEKKVLRFRIQAGDRASLDAVRIHGNMMLSDIELQNELFSKDWVPFGMIRQHGIFHKPYLDDDKVRILQAYARKGYLEAQVTHIQAQADVANHRIELDIWVKEGPLYRLGALTLSGELKPGIQRSAISIADGAPANIEQIQRDLDVALNVWREAGHPFVEAEQQARVEQKEDGPYLYFDYIIHKRELTTIQHIQIQTAGADRFPIEPRVVRKYLPFKEGDVYDHKLIERARADLMRTGYFSQVNIQPQRAAAPGQAVVHVQLLERKTWALGLAPSFQRYEGIIGNVIFADNNFMGKGVALSLTGVASSLRQNVDFWIKVPRVFSTQNGFGLQLYRKQRRYQDFMRLRPFGGRVSLNREILRQTFVQSGFRAEFVEIAPIGVPLSGYPSGIFQLGPDVVPVSTVRTSVDMGIVVDRRDNPMVPTDGSYFSSNVELVRPVLTERAFAIRLDAGFRFYWSPWFWTTIRSNTDVEHVRSLDGSALPLTERLFTGSSRRVRGFAPLSVGPVADIDTPFGTRQVIVGGTTRFSQNIQLEVPLSRKRTFALVGFFDAARGITDARSLPNAYEPAYDNLLPLQFFASAGGGIVWQTAIAPLRAMIGAPLTGRTFDKAFDFILEFGASF